MSDKSMYYEKDGVKYTTSPEINVLPELVLITFFGVFSPFLVGGVLWTLI
jgi:hypothetical protein